MQRSIRRMARSLGIFQPLKQADRCVDQWLRENGRAMSRRDRRRVAGLMARYFHYEEDVTDQLMLSFLRHYSGQREIDMEDPASVRLEIKAILDRAVTRPPFIPPAVTALLLGMILSIAAFYSWDLSQMTVTPAQQQGLRERVEKIAAADGTLTHGAIWAQVKRPLNINRYDEMSYWDYSSAEKRLDEWLAEIEARKAAAKGASGPGM